MAELEPLLGRRRPTHFEILTAAAFRWFADVAVDVAVVEVGLGGRWDATNVADGRGGGRHQRQPRPRRDHRPDPGRHRRREGGHRQAGQHARARRDRPRRWSTIFARAAGAGAEDVWRAGPRLRLRAPTTWPTAAACSTCARPAAGYAGRLPAGARRRTRATTRPWPWPRPRPSSAPRSTPTWWPRRWPRCGCRAGSRSSAATRCSCSTAPTTRRGRPRRPPPSTRRSPAGAAASSWSGMLAGRDPVEMLEAFGAGPARLVVACPPPSPRALPAAEVAGRRPGPGDRRRGGGVGAGGGGHRPGPGRRRRDGPRHRLALRGRRGPGRPHRLRRLGTGRRPTAGPDRRRTDAPASSLAPGWTEPSSSASPTPSSGASSARSSPASRPRACAWWPPSCAPSTRTTAGEHYGEHQGKPFYDDLVTFITRGPALLLVVEGPEDTFAVVRTLMGATNPGRGRARHHPGRPRHRAPPRTWSTARIRPSRPPREIALFFPGLACRRPVVTACRAPSL